MIECKAQSAKRKVTVQSSKFLVLSFNFAFCIFSFAFLCGCQNQQLYKDNRVMMGTYIEVISPDKRASSIVIDEIKRIEDLMSKYKEDSEISKLNKEGKLRLSPDMLYVIKKARYFWQLSDGAFDITVGPLLDLWGFANKQYYLPKDEEIKSALKIVGFDKIIFNNRDDVIEFEIPGMKIDLGAIAKGYAVDCAVNKLKEIGINSCLINAGGDIYCLGDRFGKPWNVAIKNPQGGGFSGYLKLKDKAVATSGNYGQYFMQNKKRYAHIFNPKTGYPIDSGLASVTVIASDCLTADAIATSIFVLGKDKGEALAKKFKDVKVRIIEDVQDNQ